MYRRVFKNSLIYGVIPQLPKIASFFVLPLITPFLTKVDYGIIGTLAAYIGAVGVLQMMGLDVALVNAFYKHPSQHKWYWRQIYGFTTLWAVVYAFILGTLLYFVIPEEANEYRWLIVCMKVIPPLFFRPGEIMTYLNYLLRQKAVPIAVNSFLVGFLGIVLSYFFIAHMNWGYMGWVVADFVTESLAGLIFCIPIFTKWKLLPIFNFKRRLIKNALRFSLPMVPHNYSAYMLDSSDRLIMERLNVSTASIGKYSLAYSFGKYTDTVTNALNQAIGPNLLELIKSGQWKTYEELVFAFQSLVLSMCFMLSLWSPQWLPVLIPNPELLGNVEHLVIIVIMGYSYRPMYVGCTQLAFYYDKTSKLWRITFIAGVINIVLNLIFIPFFGLMAAAVVTFFSFMFMGFAGFGFQYYRERKELDIKPAFWLIMIVLLLVTALYFVQAAIITKVVISLSLFLLLLLAGLKFGYGMQYILRRRLNVFMNK
jgi:O-antigen/teichoic acid export membrane protein